MSCWTFTPSTEISPQDVPLFIAGAPVIIPVDYRYPLMGAVAPPPDPHPGIINPREPLDIETIVMMLKDFEDALGFFLLLNGMLQIIVPDGFDYEWASSHKPNMFGGLRVCYIRQSLTPTAGLDQTTQQTTSTSSNGKSEESWNIKPSFWSRKPSSLIPTSNLNLDHTVEARVKDRRSKEKYAGKIGVKTRCNSEIYLTMSSHVITSAIFASDRKSMLHRWRVDPQASLTKNWISKAVIYAHNTKVCAKVFEFDVQC
jgi:hypothetical protein